MKKPLRTIDPSKLSAAVLALNPHLIIRGVGGVDFSQVRGVSQFAKKPTGVRRDKPDEEKMNKTELNFSRYVRALLQTELLAPETAIVSPWGISIRWGGGMRYTPDFCIRHSTYKRMRLIEVKGGHIRSRDIVRFKGCRAEWRSVFDFEMWQLFRGEWKKLL